MSEATPRPWKTDAYRICTDAGTLIAEATGAPRAENWVDERDIPIANAELIVKCVNSHEMLVEALREIVEDVEFSKKHSDDLGRQNTLTFILDGARAALLKAEEL